LNIEYRTGNAEHRSITPIDIQHSLFDIRYSHDLTQPIFSCCTYRWPCPVFTGHFLGE